MAVDPAIIGGMTADLMEHIEESYGEHTELVQAMVIVELRYPDDEDVSNIKTTIQWNDTAPSYSARLGLLIGALRGLL